MNLYFNCWLMFQFLFGKSCNHNITKWGKNSEDSPGKYRNRERSTEDPSPGNLCGNDSDGAILIHLKSAEQRAATLAADVDEQNIQRERECAALVKVGLNVQLAHVP